MRHTEVFLSFVSSLLFLSRYSISSCKHAGNLNAAHLPVHPSFRYLLLGAHYSSLRSLYLYCFFSLFAMIINTSLCGNLLTGREGEGRGKKKKWSQSHTTPLMHTMPLTAFLSFFIFILNKSFIFLRFYLFLINLKNKLI